MTEAISFLGVPGSPYTCKMRAFLRYRLIPYRMVVQGSPEDHDLPQPKVALLPTFYLPDTAGCLQAVVDSTPLIRRFETEREGRGVIPPDPVIALVDAILEDYADEWLNKATFHYRWTHEADIEKTVAILPRWARIDATEEEIAEVARWARDRQVGRLWVAGSNPTTAPVIEASYARFLGLLDRHLTGHRFLMGGRPGASDFGIYGQLTQLAIFDPTPAALALELAPRVIAWVDVVEDLSGLEPGDGDWLPREEAAETLSALLVEVGRTYVPFLLANAGALEQGAERVECTIDGEPWVQQPFPYQGKCLLALRQTYGALSAEDRTGADRVLEGTGCEELFTRR